MTVEEFQEKYYLATGKEISADIAVELLKDQENPWFKKILEMAEPTLWSSLSGTYTEGG